MSKLYFATICLPPPLLLIAYPMVFLFRLDVPQIFFGFYFAYFLLGVALLLICLWRSQHRLNFKLLWSVLILILGVICPPVYWFRYVKRG